MWQLYSIIYSFQQSFILAAKNLHLASCSYFAISPYNFWFAKCSIISWGTNSDREDLNAPLWLIQQPLEAAATAAGAGRELGCSPAESCHAVCDGLCSSALLWTVSHSLLWFLLVWVSTSRSSAVKQSWFSWTNPVKISTILSKYFRGEVARLPLTPVRIPAYINTDIYMRCSLSATPLKGLKIFSPGCVWNLSYFQHVANLHFLLILSTLLCYSSLCFTS